jgi:integrase/uncharacterized coiled-coil protein SlyX
MGRFCQFAGTTPQKMFDEYQQCSNEKLFRQKYGMILKAWQSELTKTYSPSTVANHVIAVESFFKYTDLPLGFIPKARRDVVYHNRDLQKEEVLAIIQAARPRERAFFAFMAQSGLRPETISNLQFKDLPELETGKTPLLVKVSKEKTKGKFGAYFSFISDDALSYLKAYLGTRTKESLTQDSFVFTAASGDGKTNIGTSQPSHVFAAIARKLKETGRLTYELREGRKPSELRMYGLRKYFRNNALVGSDNVNFFMGHKIGGSDDHYYSREDIEKKRVIYTEKGAPFLRLESNSPTETEKTIEELRQQLAQTREERDTFEARLDRIEKFLDEHMRKQKEQLKESGWKPQGSS